jgi:hypothetical protein
MVTTDLVSTVEGNPFAQTCVIVCNSAEHHQVAAQELQLFSGEA